MTRRSLPPGACSLTSFTTTGTSRPAIRTAAALTDDVFSARMAFLTHGRETSGGLEPHQDLLAEFPFLGVRTPRFTS